MYSSRKEDLRCLYNKYQSDFKNIVQRFPSDDLGGPFLMSPNSDYYKQRNPLLVVGQETFGWEKHIDDLFKQMTVYEDFNVGENYLSSPFWNVIRKVEVALENQPYSCAWTNVSKFDQNSGRPDEEHQYEICSLDHILAEEIKILRPKFCLFFTSHRYDERLRNIFTGAEFVKVDNQPLNQISKIKHPLLPKFTMRAYHPRYLRMRGLEDNFIKVIKSITKE